MGGDPLAGVSTALSWAIARQPLGVLGLSYHLRAAGEQNLVDDQQNVRGTISIRSRVGVASAATGLTDWLDVGLNMKVVRFDLNCRGQCDDAGVQSSGWAGDGVVDAFATARIQGSGRSQTEVHIRLLPTDDSNRLGLVLQVRR
jgi:hypothetical protein